MDIYYSKTIFSIARRLAIIPIMIGLLFIADEFIPQKTYQTYISKASIGQGDEGLMIYFDDKKLSVEPEEFIRIKKNDPVEYQVSVIFKQIMRVKTDGFYHVEIENGIFKHFTVITVMIFLMLTPAYIYFVNSNDVRFSENYDFITPWTCVMLLLSIFLTLYVKF